MDNDRPNSEPGKQSVAPNTSAGAPPEHEDPNPRTVYRRSDIAAAPEPVPADKSASSVWTRELSPAIIPLIVGFVLLLMLVGVLGWLSVNRMDEVGRAVLDLENQHAAKLGLLLKMRLAVTKLDNEARARDNADSRRELKPPFEFRLAAARAETTKLLQDLERPLTGEPSWIKFRDDLAAYIEITQDLRRYSLEGFDKFGVVDTELNGLLEASTQNQQDVVRKSETIQQEAARSIRSWSLMALLVGALVAAGTIWEVQRRFSEMRRSVVEARRERMFTSQLLEGMVSAVAAVDENDRIRSANAAFFRIFPRASIGASVYEKFASDDAMKMLETATASRVDKAAYRGRWVCPPGDAESEKTFDVYSSPFLIDEARGQILTMVDVTEAAKAERGLRRQESLAAVGQATAQVAHEIRNPLGSIRLGVSMLRDSVSDADGLNTIELVERGIKHLSKLVVDVAQFSRRKALEQANVEVNELVNHSLDLVADKINEKETPIEKDLTEQQLTGHWDFDQLSQVFVNVIANAIDASPKGSPVTVATGIVTPNSSDEVDDLARVRKFARVTIADHGSGMDKLTVDRIFEPFFSTKKRGTGLGLAIVKQIVEQHEGKISVTSEPEKGTTFRIDLPL